VAAMIFKGFPELLDQHGFFLPCLDPIAEDDEGHSDDAAPALNRQRSPDGGQNDPGIDGMPEVGVGSGADELVFFFKCDSGAPILSEVPASPQGDGDANPGEGDAGEGKSVGTRENVTAKKADFGCVAEKQDKAKNFEKKDAVTRRERFLADGAARLQRTDCPVCDKNDPRSLDEGMPNHVSKTDRGQVEVAAPKVSWSVEQKLYCSDALRRFDREW
jgi:hypothetical protein